MSREVVEQFFLRLGEAHDVDGWLALLDDEVVADTPFSPKGDPTRFSGKEAVERRFADARRRMPALRFYDQEILATEDPQRWLVTNQSEGTRGDGKPYANTYCWILHIRDGKVVWWAEYFDPQQLVAVRS